MSASAIIYLEAQTLQGALAKAQVRFCELWDLRRQAPAAWPFQITHLHAEPLPTHGGEWPGGWAVRVEAEE